MYLIAKNLIRKGTTFPVDFSTAICVPLYFYLHFSFQEIHRDITQTFFTLLRNRAYLTSVLSIYLFKKLKCKRLMLGRGGIHIRNLVYYSFSVSAFFLILLSVSSRMPINDAIYLSGTRFIK